MKDWPAPGNRNLPGRRPPRVAKFAPAVGAEKRGPPRRIRSIPPALPVPALCVCYKREANPGLGNWLKPAGRAACIAPSKPVCYLQAGQEGLWPWAGRFASFG